MKQKGKGIYSYIVLKLLLAFGALLLSQLMFYVCNTRVLHVDGANEWVGIVWGNIVFGMAGKVALEPWLASGERGPVHCASNYDTCLPWCKQRLLPIHLPPAFGRDILIPWH